MIEQMTEVSLCLKTVNRRLTRRTAHNQKQLNSPYTNNVCVHVQPGACTLIATLLIIIVILIIVIAAAAAAAAVVIIVVVVVVAR